MIDHTETHTTDYEASKRLYGAVLEELGYGLVREMVTTWDPSFPTRRICAFGPPNKPVLWLAETKEPSTPRHIAFTAPSRSSVDAFHSKALALGAKDNGAPGVRAIYHPTYYGAFVLDPDGNNIEAVCHSP